MSTQLVKRPQSNHTEAAIPATAFEIIKERALGEIAALGNPYHNRFHTEARVMPACQEYAREAQLSPRNAQKLVFGALYHDHGHAGRTYRQLVPGVEGEFLSNEEFAGRNAVEAARQWYPEQECEEIRSMIHASSHGQNKLHELPKRHAALLYRHYKPATGLENILVLADVSSFRWGLGSYMQDGINLIGESCEECLPRNFVAFLEGGKSFLDCIDSRIKGAANLFPEPFLDKLAIELNQVRDGLVEVSNPDTSLHRTWKRAFEDALLKQRKALGLE